MRRWLLLSALVLAASVALDRLGLPTPWLFGGLAGALAYALSRPSEPLQLPSFAFRIGQATVGVVVGSSIAWGSLADLGPRWAIVAAVSTFSLVVSLTVGRLLIRRGASPVTAAFSSIAGGAAGLTAMADDLHADARTVAVLQYLRLLVVLVSMPIVVGVVFSADVAPAAVGAGDSTLGIDLLYVAIAGGIGLVLGERLKMPSPAILGPMLVGALVGIQAPFDDATVPEVIEAIGYLAIGVQVGLRFTVASLRSIWSMVPTALFTITVVLLACAGLGWVLVVTTGAAPLDAYLATTPGGIYAVMGTSQATGGDVTFVAATQVLRLVIILASAPFLSAYLRRTEQVPMS